MEIQFNSNYIIKQNVNLTEFINRAAKLNKCKMLNKGFAINKEFWLLIIERIQESALKDQII